MVCQKYDENYNGEKEDKSALDEPKNKKRNRTDFLCLIFIFIHWMVMCIVGGSFGETGNVQAIFAPTDYKGRLCGVDNGVVNKPYGYLVNMYLDVVCVDNCFGETRNLDVNSNAYDQMVCKSDSVDETYKTADTYDSYYFGYQYLFCGSTTDTSTCGYGPCNFKLKSYNIGFYCMLSSSGLDPFTDGTAYSAITNGDAGDYAPDTSVFDHVAEYDNDDAEQDTANGALGTFMQDMVTARNWIFGFGFVVCLVVSFFFTKLMSTMLLDMLVWSCIFITGGLFVFLAAYSYVVYQDWKDNDDTDDMQVNGMQALSFIFIVVAVLYWCLIICICSKIKLCIALTKVAGKAVRDIPLVVLFPIVQVAGLVLFLVPWIYYFLYLNSQGCKIKSGYCNDDDEDVCFKDSECADSVDCNVGDGKSWIFASSDYYPDECLDQSPNYQSYDNIQLAQYYLMFCYFWTSQFIIAMGQLVFALTFFLWYFTEDAVEVSESGGEASCCRRWFGKLSGSGRDDRLLFHAMWQSTYHAGSAAFGSLVIAIIKFIRFCIAKLQAQCEKGVPPCPAFVPGSISTCWSGMGKGVIRIIFCCLQCCMCCIERCMKFINKHAYIIIAIHGDVSFCSAAVRSFFLILRNIRLIAAITLVQEFVTIIGKFFVITVTGALSYVMMERYISDQLNSLIGPVLFVMILAYFVSDMFMVVYSMAIDVLMHCFMSDKEMHEDNNPPPFCARKTCEHLHELSAFVEANKQEEEKKRKSSIESKTTEEGQI